MGSISNILQSAAQILGNARTILSTSTFASGEASNRPIVLSDGTVVQDGSDVHLYNMQPEDWEEPEVDDNVNTTSAGGGDVVLHEDEIASTGTEDDGEDMLDNVEVFEYDLAQYSDSVSSIDLSGIPGDAELHFLGYDANGAAIVSFGEDGVVVTLEGSAAAYVAELEYSGQVGPLGVDVEAMLGASAEGSGSIKINPMEGDFEVEIQAGVVVGATINGNGELELGHIKLEAGATGIAGLAADANIDVGFDDWNFEADFGGKLAFLVGGGVDVSFSVDAGEIVMDVAGAGRVVLGVLEDPGQAVNDGIDWVEGAKNFIDSLPFG